MSQRPPSTKGGMTDKRREKLMDIQKREQLKGMLINKFKVKYGDKPQLSSYINNEVAKFLKNDRLTEKNLQGLDSKINKEAELRDKKEDILSQRSGKAPSVRSVSGKSVRSEAMGSRASARSATRNNDDARSVTSKASTMSRATDIYSEINEEDEWYAIQKFNTLLHYEEQKQALLREKERKRLIKQELDAQMKDRSNAKLVEKSEQAQYDQMQAEHVKLLGAREQEKLDAYKAKVAAEKESRDRQLKIEKSRKRVQQKADFKQEMDLVDRLQNEMVQEKEKLANKKAQEKIYLQKMLEENDREKAKKMAVLEHERRLDIEAQEEHARMLDKQAADREHEFQQRERRAQEFMNRMASNVIEGQNKKQEEENAQINRYEMEREMRLRLEDERRIELRKQQKADMKVYLNSQMQAKQERERAEKLLNDQQAEMWKKDREIYEQEEKRLQDKIKGINNENASFLDRQMQDKKLRNSNLGMNKYEKQYNKPLLKVLNDKRKPEQE